MPGWEELAEAGWKLACDAAAEKDAAVFADLGPAPDTEAAPASSAYGLVAQQFAALGAKNFLFETLSSDVGIVEAVKALRVAGQTFPLFSALFACFSGSPRGRVPF